MNRDLPMVTLLPRHFHVRTRGGTRFLGTPVRAATPMQRQAGQLSRREAFIKSERLSMAEVAYLPYDFDPAAPVGGRHG